MNRHSVLSGRSDGGKRERILEAAIKVFADKGFYNAKVSDIAHLAGVADGTIYLYFKSKDDLLISLFEDRMERVNQNLRSALDPSQMGADGAPCPPLAPLDRLRRALIAHMDLARQNPQVAEVLTVELRQSSKFLKEYQPVKFGEFLKLIAEPIEEGQRDGSIRANLDAPTVARAIFGAIDEMTLAWVLSPRAAGRAGGRSKKGSIDLSVVAAQLCDLFIEGLREPSPSHSHSTNAKRRVS